MKRSFIIASIVVCISMVLLGKLFYIQVIDNTYADRAKSLSSKLYTINPDRGLILDRNGKIIVSNDLVYDLVLTFPFRLSQFDTAGFCQLLEISTEKFIEMYQNALVTQYRRRSIFIKNLEPSAFARIQEGLYRFSNFSIETRTDRKYEAPIASHVLGYIAEISKIELDKDKENQYEAGDYIGKSGIEQYYERYLRGVKGRNYYLVDRFSQVQGSYAEGVYDVDPEPGKKLTSTLDLDLQQYGEQLMKGKIGSIVAIEPSTGEILSLVSSPAYDPSMFSIKGMAKNYRKLALDSTKPLYNRAVTARYPPGSVFKTVMALVGLEEGVVTEYSRYRCNAGFRLGGLHIRCHPHAPNPDLKFSIITSCNAFYCGLFRDLMNQNKFASQEEAYASWRSYMASFGLGSELGIDVNNENGGNVPLPEYYNRILGKGSWKYSTIISLAIGQGEILLTPLQIANVAGIIANRGWFYTPHVVKEIAGEELIPVQYTTKHFTKVSADKFEIVIDAMNKVTQQGTSAASQIPGIDICGKTGTVQNPHGKNHSVYMSFAPKDNPKIAIAVVVENAGYGSTWAAPIAHLMIEKYMFPDSATSRPDLQKRMFEGVVSAEETH